MVQAVWKYPIEFTDSIEIEMPRGADVLHVGMQGEQLCLWCLVYPEGELTKRRFRIAGTGHPIEEGDMEHIGTVHIADDSLIFHIFEITEYRIPPYEE